MSESIVLTHDSLISVPTTTLEISKQISKLALKNSLFPGDSIGSVLPCHQQMAPFRHLRTAQHLQDLLVPVSLRDGTKPHRSHHCAIWPTSIGTVLGCIYFRHLEGDIGGITKQQLCLGRDLFVAFKGIIDLPL